MNSQRVTSRGVETVPRFFPEITCSGKNAYVEGRAGAGGLFAPSSLANPLGAAAKSAPSPFGTRRRNGDGAFFATIPKGLAIPFARKAPRPQLFATIPDGLASPFARKAPRPQAFRAPLIPARPKDTIVGSRSTRGRIDPAMATTTSRPQEFCP
jgi:hypothetical protein